MYVRQIATALFCRLFLRVIFFCVIQSAAKDLARRRALLRSPPDAGASVEILRRSGAE
jgi:hypothetical protein